MPFWNFKVKIYQFIVKIYQFLVRHDRLVRNSVVLKKTKFLSKIGLAFGDQSLSQFVKKCNVVLLPWWLHPFPGSLQAKFYLCSRRQMPTRCLMTSVSWTSLDAVNHCVCIPWIVLRSLNHTYIWIQVSSIITRLQKSHRIPPKSVQNGLWKKHSIRLVIIIEIRVLGNPFGWKLSRV
jgi:hypothetical protein